MIIFLYILGIMVALTGIIFALALEQQDFKNKTIRTLDRLKGYIPFIKYWSSEDMLIQLQQRLLLVGIIIIIGFGFALYHYLN